MKRSSVVAVFISITDTVAYQGGLLVNTDHILNNIGDGVVLDVEHYMRVLAARKKAGLYIPSSVMVANLHIASACLATRIQSLVQAVVRVRSGDFDDVALPVVRLISNMVNRVAGLTGSKKNHFMAVKRYQSKAWTITPSSSESKAMLGRKSEITVLTRGMISYSGGFSRVW